MTKALDLTRLAFLSTLATAMLLSGCTTTDAKKSAETAIPTYATVDQVNAIPPCKAKVEHVETFCSLLTAADGKKFRIGSQAGEQEVWHFVATLKEGETCEFPDAFLVFENRKFYITADEIKAMPPCKATVECAGPCFSLFRAIDGKMFVIGDPGSKPEVWKFLQTLEKGQTYEFPVEFLDYQKK